MWYDSLSNVSQKEEDPFHFWSEQSVMFWLWKYRSPKIRMFLYARIYWLAEFGDVSCLQFNYMRVETLTPTWEDLVRHWSDNFKSEVRQNSVSDRYIQ
jgi:hypothetical protein